MWNIPKRAAHKRSWLLIRLSLLVALLVCAAPAQAVSRQQVRLAIKLGNGRVVNLCIDRASVSQATGAAFVHADSLPELLARAQAAGATRCNAPALHNDALPRAQNVAPNQAGLVIDFGDGRVSTFCVDLGADGQMTGEELLRASQLPVIIEYSGGIGGAICKIDTVGSNFPAEPCFAKCTLRPGEQCVYWSYSQLANDAWTYAQIGPSGTIVHAGDVDGWAWGAGTVAHGAQPQLRTFAAICAANASTSTPSATPTLLPTPTQTAAPTLLPTAPPSDLPPPVVIMPFVATPIPSPTPTQSPTPTSRALPTSTLTPAALAASPLPASPQGLANTAIAPSATLPPPTLLSTATPLPLATDSVPTAALLAVAPTRSALAGGMTHILIPLIQRVVPAAIVVTAQPTALATLAVTASFTATPMPAATPTPLAHAPSDADPTRSYPYFGGMATVLIAGWVLLRRRRGPRAR